MNKKYRKKSRTWQKEECKTFARRSTVPTIALYKFEFWNDKLVRAEPCKNRSSHDLVKSLTALASVSTLHDLYDSPACLPACLPPTIATKAGTLP